MMKNAKAIISITCLVISTSSLAGTAEIKSSNNQFGAQYISTDVNYQENGKGTLGTSIGTLDTENGSVIGSGLSVSTMWGVNNYFQAQISRNHGKTTYTGALIGGPFGSVLSTSSAKMTDFSMRYGKGYVIDDESTSAYDVFMITPFVELGQHKWERGVNLGETYTNSYLGLGALFQYSPTNSGLVTTLDGLIGQTFGSNIVVNGPFGFSESLGNSTYTRIGLTFDYAFTKRFHGNFGSEYTSFAYGMSGGTPLGGDFTTWEPDSTTAYTVFKIGLGYAF